MMNLIALGAILGWSCILWKLGTLYRRAPRINHIPIISICFLILCTYVGSLLEQLPLTVWTLYGIGLTALMASITYCVKKRRLEQFWTNPANIIFVVFSFVALVYFRNSAFVSWDEFSHWGLVAKDIFLKNSLPVAGGPIRLVSYPPGLPLFQYFFIKPGGFSEGLIYSATSVFVLAALTTVVPLQKTSKKTLIGAALLVVIFLIEPFFDWQLAYADHVLGVAFGSAIVIGLDQRSGTRNWLWSLPILMILVLVKPIGILFAIFAFGIITSFVTWKIKSRAHRFRSHISPKMELKVSKVWHALIVNILITSIGIALVYLSWKSHVDLRFGNVGRGLPNLPNFSDLTESFNGKRLTQDLTTLKAFGGFFMRSAVPFLLCFGGAWVLTRKSSNNETGKALRVVFIMGALSYIAYLFILLVLYLYFFGAYEGPRLASIGRYTGSYYLGAMMVFVFFTFRDYQQSFRKNIYSRIMLALVLIWCGIGAQKSRVLAGPKGLNEGRISIQKKLAPIQKLASPKDRIYIVWQRSNGSQLNIARYELYPRQLNAWCWALGEKYVGFNPDVWTCDITVEEFREKLAGFDFVLIGQAFEPFWDRYGSIFSDSTKRSKTGVFKVVHTSGILFLAPIEVK